MDLDWSCLGVPVTRRTRMISINSPGYELDNEAGLTLYHANARGYDQVLGRFMQIDPLADQFPGWTPYQYTHNNPLGAGASTTGAAAGAAAQRERENQ